MSQHVAKLEDGTENHLKTGGEQITYANKATAGSVDPRCKGGLPQLKIRRKHRYIVYKIDPETEAVVVETIGARDADLDALLNVARPTRGTLSSTTPTRPTTAGRRTSLLSCRGFRRAAPYSKMAYTHAKEEHVREVYGRLRHHETRTTDEARSLVTGEAESESDQEVQAMTTSEKRLVKYKLDLLDLVDHGRAELARLLADAVLAERRAETPRPPPRKAEIAKDLANSKSRPS